MKNLEEAIRKKIDLEKGRSRELWRGFNITEAVVTVNSKGEVELTVYKWKDENKNELIHKSKSIPLPSYSFFLDLLDAFKKQLEEMKEWMYDNSVEGKGMFAIPLEKLLGKKETKS